MDQDYLLHTELQTYNKQIIGTSVDYYIQRERLGQPQIAAIEKTNFSNQTSTIYYVQSSKERQEYMHLA